MIESNGRWRRRARLALGVRMLAFAVPIALSVGVTALANWLLPAPASSDGRLAWWIVLLAVAAGALVVGDRLARRLLPLAAFLELSLAFPDRAPSRFRVALRSAATQQLARRVEELRRKGADADASASAGRVLELVAMLTAHDRATRGHSERVRAHAELLAEQMGLAPADRDRLRWAALLHDVGKAAVPAEVLNKRGPLDAVEWQQVKAHPLEGEQLTASLRPWLGDWASAVGQHHEWWNGTGYPRGLRGEEISLGARIVSVADAFEVITAPRPYKKAMSADAARRELVKSASVQFDPAVVRALLDVSLGRLHAAVGLVGWLGQLPVAWRAAVRTSARGAVTATVAGGTLIAAGLIDVPAPGQRTPRLEVAQPRLVPVDAPLPVLPAEEPPPPVPTPSVASAPRPDQALPAPAPPAPAPAPAPAPMAPVTAVPAPVAEQPAPPATPEPVVQGACVVSFRGPRKARKLLEERICPVVERTGTVVYVGTWGSLVSRTRPNPGVPPVQDPRLWSG